MLKLLPDFSAHSPSRPFHTPSALARPRPAATGLALLLISAPILAAQNLSTWQGGPGAWLDAAKWTPNGVPNAAAADVVIDSAPGTSSTVTYGYDPAVSAGVEMQIGRLRIDAGDQLLFTNRPNVLSIVDSSFAGAGTIQLDGTMAMPFTNNSLYGNKTITGTGTLTLGSLGHRPFIRDNTTTSVLIQGSAVFGVANSSNPKIINSGIIHANIPGQDMDFHGQGGVNGSVNTGEMKATNGATLSIGQGVWLNTNGNVRADGAGSLVSFYRGGLMDGGTVSATGGGRLQVGGSFPGGNGGYTFKDVTLNGPVDLVQNLLLLGSLTNNGRMTIPSGGRLEVSGNAAVSVHGNGSGEIVLDAPEDDGPELIDQGNSGVATMPWLFDNVKVRGRGNVGYRQSNGAIDNVIITNAGTFEADVDGEALRIDVSGFENGNGGVLRATGSGNNPLGGILRLAVNRPLLNTGGTIEALNGGRVEAAFARIEGGLIRNGRPHATPAVPPGFIPLANMTIVNPTGSGSVPLNPQGMILEGDLTLGAAGVNQNAGLVGEIKNAGTLRIAASGGNTSFLRMGEAATGKPHVNLTGGGQVILGTFADGTLGNDNARLLENLDANPQGQWQFSRPFHNVDNTIRGFGWLGGDPSYGYFLSLTNSGIITADVADKTLRVGFNDGTNTGFIRSANNGTLSLRTTGLTNTGGVLEALDGSAFNFISTSRITGGTIRNVGAPADAANFGLGHATLISPTVLQGPFVVENGRNLGLAGVIPNQGSIRIRSANNATAVMLGVTGIPDVSLVGGGEMILGDPSPDHGGTFSGIYETQNNTTLTLENQKLRGFGEVGLRDVRQLDINNKKWIEADQNGRELRFLNRTLTNTPLQPGDVMMQAKEGGQLYLSPAKLNNTNASISALRGTVGTSSVKFGSTTITGGAVSSQAANASNPNPGKLEIHGNLTADGGVVFTNEGQMLLAEFGGNTFNGLANGGSSIRNSGTLTKLGSTEYTVFSPLENTGAMHVQSGILRWKGGGTLTGSTISAAQNTHLTFQDTGFTFSGSNAFTGSGNHWFANSTITLANPATTLDFEKFNFGNEGTTLLTGPGTVNVNAGGGITIHPGPTTFSGVKLVTREGSSSTINKSNTLLQFNNSATWDNHGAVSMGGYINVVAGDAGTLFRNMPGGSFRATGAQENRFAMPWENAGEIHMDTGSMAVTVNGTFKNGSAKMQPGQALNVTGGTTVTFEGPGNTATGDGFFAPTDANFAFAPDAKLTGETIGLFGASNVSGNGTLEVTKTLQLADNGGFRAPNFNVTVSGTHLRIAPPATALFDVRGFQAGSGGTLHLNNNALLEIAGRLNHYYTSSIASDGTGLLRTLTNSKTYFHRAAPNGFSYGEMTCSAPFDIAGQVFAEQGKQVTFSGGGLFNETAKISPNDPASNISFTGAGKVYRSRGRAVEFPGTGYVNLSGTTLQFEPSTVSTTGNGQLDETRINAGARVAFHGNNVVKSVGTHGTLNTTGFVFQTGSQVVDNATLQTSGTANDSIWNASGQKLELKNGAKFVNGGRFVIQSRIGTLANDPGIFGDATTLFHNTATGRIVHDSNTLTEIGVDFLNEGFLEFRAGNFNFLKKFSGRGGIAASNGAEVTFSLAGVPIDQQPQMLELSQNAKMSIDIPAGQSLAASISSNGAQLVAAGGLNLVAAGGLNMVAAGGGNIVAAGGMNMVAAGGGNITARGAGTFINANQLIGNDGSTLIGNDGSTLLARVSALVSSNSVASLLAGKLEAAQGIQFNNAAGIAGPAGLFNGGGTGILSHNGGVLVAAGGGNLVAAGGGNLVAAGGGNAVAPNSAGRSKNASKAPAATFPSIDGLTGVVGGDALLAQAKALGTEATQGIIFVDTGGNAEAKDGGSILAEAQGIIAGGGTFKGPGLIKDGGKLLPGSEVGPLTWNGPLAVQTGGTLEIGIGSISSYDRVINTGGVIMDGTVTVQFLNNFQSTVQPTDSFDIITSDVVLSGAFLNVGRVPVKGTYGSFAVTTVNDGKTLRLSDYQTVLATFNRWAQRFGLTGDDALPGADPNGSGLTNLMKYALGLDYSASGHQGTSTGIFEDGQGGRFLTLSYTKPAGSAAPSDLTYEPQRAASATTGPWSGLPADVIPTGPAAPGPGDLETITVRSTHPISPGQPTDFLRLRVVLTPAP